MKSTRTTFPEMYAKMYTDWLAIGWSMLLGKPPDSPAMEPKLKATQADAGNGRADQRVSVKPTKKARAKPAVKKAQAKPAAKKAQAKPAAKKARAKPAVKKAQAKPAKPKDSR